MKLSDYSTSSSPGVKLNFFLTMLNTIRNYFGWKGDTLSKVFADLEGMSAKVRHLTLILNSDDVDLKLSILDLNYDAYTEIVPGTSDRLVEHKDDIKFEDEEVFRGLLDEINFDRFDVIFVRFEKGSLFDNHRHPHKEIIYCVRGSYIGTAERDRKFTKGDIQVIPAMVVHKFYPLEDGQALILLEK